MNKLFYLLVLLVCLSSCNSQTKQQSKVMVGGPCQDCEALYEYKELDKTPNAVDTLVGFEHKNPKLKITGTVLKHDGITPAKNVILYFYQTNQKGIYEQTSNPTKWGKRHGKFRSWIKTDATGKFSFYTFRPAPYPDGREPEHIHLYIKEPDKNIYYVDSYLFADDPKLSKKEMAELKNRGGSGILSLEEKDGILTANRKIILGLNIPNY